MVLADPTIALAKLPTAAESHCEVTGKKTYCRRSLQVILPAKLWDTKPRQNAL
jgi:hypothetical protein